MGCLSNAVLALLITSAASESVSWFQTAASTADRLTEQTPLSFSSQSSDDAIEITIDTTKTFQKIHGFGGALTQSSATVYKQLPEELQAAVIEAYYGPTGIGYTTGRMPIHSCDFSVDTYTFDDVAGDYDLEKFDTTVAYDQNLSLPMIHAAIAVNPSLRLFGSPWSPPAWMKDNNDMLWGGSLLDEAKESWAQYFAKWITAYEAQGVPVWGVTVQNEPEAKQPWESCIYTPEQTRDFVAEHLGPALEEAHPDVKILGYDHNKDHIEEWADALLGADSASAKYMDGIAFHWYSGSCFDNVANVAESYPDALLLPSEACFELTVLSDDEGEATWIANGTWSKGEGYGYDIMGDLNAGSSGWTDWNILLDHEGGPNHVNNFCDAPVIADLREDAERAVYLHPQYFYLGHFSKFLLPDSVRVHSTVGGSDAPGGDCAWPYGGCDATTLQATAFLRPDGQTAVVVMNCGEDKEMKLAAEGGVITNTVPASSIQTYLLPAAN